MNMIGVRTTVIELDLLLAATVVLHCTATLDNSSKRNASSFPSLIFFCSF